MAELFKIKHKPTVTNLPLVNGTVESLHGDIPGALQAMLRELKLALRDWISIINFLPSVIKRVTL